MIRKRMQKEKLGKGCVTQRRLMTVNTSGPKLSSLGIDAPKKRMEGKKSTRWRLYGEMPFVF